MHGREHSSLPEAAASRCYPVPGPPRLTPRAATASRAACQAVRGVQPGPVAGADERGRRGGSAWPAKVRSTVATQEGQQNTVTAGPTGWSSAPSSPQTGQFMSSCVLRARVGPQPPYGVR